MSANVVLDNRDGNQVTFKDIKTLVLRDTTGQFTETFTQASGTLTISDNGSYDTVEFAKATVNVTADKVLEELPTPATANDIIANKQAYDDKGNIVYGTVPVQTVSDPVVYPSLTIPAGYYDETTFTAPFQRSLTVTSSVVSQTYQSSKDEVIDKVVVNAQPNLLAENIKKGVTICGVKGTYEADVGYLADFADGSFEGDITADMLKGATQIRAYAFYGMTNITTVTIPEGVTSILMSAFQGCTELTSVYIPSSVNTIAAMAFASCSSLKTAYVMAETPPTGGFVQTMFPSTIETIYVPRDSVDAYKEDDIWSPYADKIKPYQTDDLIFELNDDGTGYIVSENWDKEIYMTGGSYDLIIPNTYNGLPVTEIKKEGFYQANIKSVKLPLYLEALRYKCFGDGYYFSTIPASVRIVEDYIQSGFGFYSFYLLGKPESISSRAFGITNNISGIPYTRTVYVPWSEGEVENAPWGATEVIYDYTI